MGRHRLPHRGQTEASACVHGQTHEYDEVSNAAKQPVKLLLKQFGYLFHLVSSQFDGGQNLLGMRERA
jgi:hypothetical protein